MKHQWCMHKWCAANWNSAFLLLSSSSLWLLSFHYIILSVGTLPYALSLYHRWDGEKPSWWSIGEASRGYKCSRLSVWLAIYLSIYLTVTALCLFFFFCLGSWKEANSGKDTALWISDKLGPLACPSNTQIIFEVSSRLRSAYVYPYYVRNWCGHQSGVLLYRRTHLKAHQQHMYVYWFGLTSFIASWNRLPNQGLKMKKLKHSWYANTIPGGVMSSKILEGMRGPSCFHQ